MRKRILWLALGAWAATHGSAPCSLSQNALGEYQISSYDDLKQVGVSCSLDGAYRLVSDIDASPSASENCDAEGVCAGFAPIGSSSNPFAGFFHGGGHVISGLSINRSGSSYVGLFAASSGTLDSLGLQNAHVKASGSAGVLAGNNSGIIKACYGSGSVSGNDNVGGLVGYNDYNGSIGTSYGSASVSGNNSVGGLVGYNDYHGSIGSSYASGNVSGNDYVGGLVGNNGYASSISSSYASGSVDGNNEVGGLVGFNEGSVGTSYAIGRVQGQNKTGGLLGTSLPTLSDSFWDMVSSGQSQGGYLTDISSSSTAPLNEDQAKGLNTAQMRDPTALAKLGSFAEGGTWRLLAGQSYPGLRSVNNAPFAFADTLLSSLGSADLQGLLANDYDVENGQNSLLWRVDSLSAGTLAGSKLTLPSGFGKEDTLTVYYRAGELQGGDTLWGNQARSLVLFGLEGEGSEASPYLVQDYQDLKKVGVAPYGLGSVYRLVSDIDASPSASENCDAAGVCAGFVPIGSSSTPFAGTFHGGGHVISGLSINRPSTKYVGLFASSSGTLDSLGLQNAQVKASASAGVLAGNNSGTIKACYGSGRVAIQNRDAGGLVGSNSGDIRYCYANVSVNTEKADAGGLVGSNSRTISMSYAEGAVSGPTEIGGLVGWSIGGSINACYAVGSVLGSGEYIGGLVGWNLAAISVSYASGRVTSSGYFVGGLVGQHMHIGSLSSNYWDTESSGRSSGGLIEILSSDGSSSTSTYAAPQPSQAQGLSTDSMHSQASFDASWDFEHTWILYEGHTAPLLRAFMKPLVVGVADASKVYDGSALGTPVATYDQAIDASLLQGSPTFTGSGLTAVEAGTYALGVNGGLYSSQQGYSISYASSKATLTITPASLAVVADTVRKTYGAVDPAFTYKATGLVGSDQLSGALARTAGENVGTYDIDQGTLANPNYDIDFTGAKLHIAPASLSVVADTLRKTYGKADPALTYKATGLLGSDKLSGALSRTAGENVGSYAIGKGDLSASANYSLTFTGAELHIAPASLTVVADTVRKTYGEADPALTYKATGLLGGDQLSGTLSRTAGENVGSYAIGKGELSASANYSLTFTGAELHIAPASLTVVADTVLKTYGKADPALTYKATGLLGSDQLSGSLSRTAGENAGAYAIGKGTLANPNYSLSFIGSQLHIAPAALTVVADTVSKTYGEADPVLTYKATGLLGSDRLTGTLARTAGENAGSYAIGKGTLANPNYSLSFTGSQLHIAPAALTVVADTVLKTYGKTDPALTYKATGLVGSDQLSGALSRTAGENAGSYAIGKGNLSASANYALSFTGAELHIAPASLTVVADTVRKTYGEADPVLTYKATGLLGGDQLSGTLSRTAGEDVGSYAIGQGSLSAGANYSFSFAGAQLRIARAPLRIAVLNDTLTLGDTLGALRYAFSGFVKNEDSTVLTRLSVSHEALDTAGTYVLRLEAAAANYEISLVDGLLIVTPSLGLASPVRETPRLQMQGNGLYVQGLRGKLEVFSLQGQRMASLYIARDGVYALDLAPGRYLLRQGVQGWPLNLR